MPQPDLTSTPAHFHRHIHQAWQRFGEACGDAAGVAAVAARPELARVWAGSDFVVAECILRPQRLVEGVVQGEFARGLDAAELAAAAAEYCRGVADAVELQRRLRRFQRWHKLRIAWRDLAGFADLAQTMAEMSALAEGCIQTALRFHTAWLEQQWGVPRDALGRRLEMVVVGLGKLGGRELNYSSDVDLLFAFGASGTAAPSVVAAARVSPPEFFVKLARNLLAALSRVTADGFVFRTDMRLRPNGNSGALVLSFAAMEHYYQTHGRDWERYALVKARVVAGDAAAGQALLALLRPFVYRRYLDFGAFEALREMQQLLERQRPKQVWQDDLKLGCGGIREVEFFVQSHQLMRGGRQVGLQTASLYAALAALVELGMVAADAAARLKGAYVFLRDSEHRLQMVQDRQTHTLPQSPWAQARLAWSMGFASWAAYTAALAQHRQAVRALFAGVAVRPQPGEAVAGLRDVWLGAVEVEVAEARLVAAGFDGAAGMPQLLNELRAGRLYQAYSSVERDRLDRLMPLALAQAAKRPQAARTLRAFVSVVERIGRRSAYLSLLSENPAALQQLLQLCAVSPWLSRYIGQHPVVLDELLQPPVDARPPSVAGLTQELEQHLTALAADDAEGEMNALREFMLAQVLRVAAADVNQQMSAAEVMLALSRLAQVLLGKCLQQALAALARKQARPAAEVGIIAYGKLASGELGYYSDVDIVLCYGGVDAAGRVGGAAAGNAAYFYTRVAQRLTHLLTARTYAGALYELDMRLRPSGRKGALVTSLAGLLDYQLRSAWVWEHLALVRARAVAGSAEFVQAFEVLRARVLARPRDARRLRAAVCAMRHRIATAAAQSRGKGSADFDLKRDYGGMVDIEFIVQYLILRYARQYPALLKPRQTVAQLATLRRVGLLAAEQAGELADIYAEYLRHALQLKLRQQALVLPPTTLASRRAQVRGVWTRVMGG